MVRSSKDERQTRDEFGSRYSLGTADVLLEMERVVLGGDWGANGYTTVAQADLIGDGLELSPGKRLLDVGTGQGWPGLYLAHRTGCEVVVTDLPIEGLEVARQRARTANVPALGAVVSSARALPFKDRAFDAICHADVMC